jgi:hypothetical protein
MFRRTYELFRFEIGFVRVSYDRSALLCRRTLYVFLLLVVSREWALQFRKLGDRGATCAKLLVSSLSLGSQWDACLAAGSETVSLIRP